MKLIASIMPLIFISTFLGLVIAALVAKTHQPKNKRTTFRFPLAFMDITFYFICTLTLLDLCGRKQFWWGYSIVILLILFLIFYCYDKWERSQ
ncbi:hypothetical protein DWA21_22725 [Acinetobacter baumannii]|nr:hypothetical protein DWA21_22725 [Acinetobacter baumannii]